MDAESQSSPLQRWHVYTLLFPIFWFFCALFDNFIFTLIVAIILGGISEFLVAVIPSQLITDLIGKTDPSLLPKKKENLEKTPSKPVEQESFYDKPLPPEPPIAVEEFEVQKSVPDIQSSAPPLLEAAKEEDIIEKIVPEELEVQETVPDVESSARPLLEAAKVADIIEKKVPEDHSSSSESDGEQQDNLIKPDEPSLIEAVKEKVEDIIEKKVPEDYSSSSSESDGEQQDNTTNPDEPTLLDNVNEKVEDIKDEKVPDDYSSSSESEAEQQVEKNLESSPKQAEIEEQLIQPKLTDEVHSAVEDIQEKLVEVQENFASTQSAVQESIPPATKDESSSEEEQEQQESEILAQEQEHKEQSDSFLDRMQDKIQSVIPGAKDESSDSSEDEEAADSDKEEESKGFFERAKDKVEDLIGKSDDDDQEEKPQLLDPMPASDIPVETPAKTEEANEAVVPVEQSDDLALHSKVDIDIQRAVDPFEKVQEISGSVSSSSEEFVEGVKREEENEVIAETIKEKIEEAADKDPFNLGLKENDTKENKEQTGNLLDFSSEPAQQELIQTVPEQQQPLLDFTTISSDNTKPLDLEENLGLTSQKLTDLLQDVQTESPKAASSKSSSRSNSPVIEQENQPRLSLNDDDVIDDIENEIAQVEKSDLARRMDEGDPWSNDQDPRLLDLKNNSDTGGDDVSNRAIFGDDEDPDDKDLDASNVQRSSSSSDNSDSEDDKKDKKAKLNSDSEEKLKSDSEIEDVEAEQEQLKKNISDIEQDLGERVKEKVHSAIG